MGYNDLWFVENLDGGSCPFPKGKLTARLSVTSRGAIDVPSGRLRLDYGHGFKDSDPLDAACVPGTWLVSSLRDLDESLDLGVLLIRAQVEAPHRVTTWVPATRGGRELNAQTRGLLLGDSSVPGVMGSDEYAESFPMMGLARNRGIEWSWPTGKETGLFLPGSTLRSFYSGRLSINPYPPRNYRPSYARAWLGLNEQGVACELVIDLAAIFRAEPYAQVVDAWSEPLAAGPATLINEDDVSPESADLGAAFVAGAHGAGMLLALGDAPLEGQLYAFDPLFLKNPLRLPVVVPRGSYPAYVLLLDNADLLLVRLGRERAIRWLSYDGPAERGAYIQIEAGMYCVSTAAVWDAVTNDEALREDMRRVATTASIDAVSLESRRDLGFVVNGDTGGDMPAWCYIGLDEAGAVVAVAVALITDVVYAHRPPSEDSDLLQDLRQRIEAVPEDSDPDELRSYYWPRIEEATRGGEVTPSTRAEMYQLRDLLEQQG